MQTIVFRLGVLAVVIIALWATVSIARRIITLQRQQAFAAAGTSLSLPLDDAAQSAPVRILAFSSATCRPCHTLQRPALEQVAARHGTSVAISWIDAPSSPELTDRYHVLTVPTTVVLDAANRVQAVNYGFAPTQRLLEQIDAVMAQAA